MERVIQYPRELVNKARAALVDLSKIVRESRVWEMSRADRLTFFLGLFLVGSMVFMAIFADVVAPYSPTSIDETAVRQSPSFAHLLGTDSLGRDVLSRVIHGARASLLVGLASVMFASAIGATLGVITGYYGGNLDRIVTLPMDAMYSFPSFLTALLIVVTLGSNLLFTSIAVAIGLLPKFYRTVRSASVALKEEEFVEAEVSIGASNMYIIFRHIYPLCFSVLGVVMTVSIATAILSIAGLGFLGLGLPPPTPEWGADLSSGRPNILSGVWWTTMGPAIFIFLTVLGFNLLGEGLSKMFGASLEEI